MKNQGIQKNIKIVATAFILVCSLFLGSLAIAEPGDTSLPPLNAGRAAQGVETIHIGNTNLTGVGLDAAELGKESLLAKASNLMVVFGTLLVRGNTFIGKTSEFEVFSPITLSTTPLPEKRLNIAGSFLASDLSYFGVGGSQERLCTDETGLIQICTAGVCGNSVIEVGETCDDGNTSGGDGCSITCQTENICGNGIVESGEACDDGNTSDGDSCSSICENVLDLRRVSAEYCYTGSGPYGATEALSIVLPDSSFVTKWEWQEASNITLPSATSTNSEEGLNGNKSLASIQSTMVANQVYSNTGATQYQGSTVNISAYANNTSTPTFDQNIYRVRALNASNSPVTSWLYVNTLEPIGQKYDPDPVYNGSGWMGGLDLLTNTTSAPNNPNLQWGNSYNDTTNRDFFNYVVQRRPSGGSWTTLATYTPGNQESSYTDTSFSGLSSGTYEYRIRVENSCGGAITHPANGAFSYSNVISVTK